MNSMDRKKSPSSRISRVKRRRQQTGKYLKVILAVGFFFGIIGGGVILAGNASMPIAQAFFAAFPEALVGPGEGEILVDLRDPITRKPISGQVRILIRGVIKAKEIGYAQVKGRTVVPFKVPDLAMGHYTLLARVEGALKKEELGQEVLLMNGNHLAVKVDRRRVLPGEKVNVVVTGSRVLPRRPAAKEAAAIVVIDPYGNEIQRLSGTSSAAGFFSRSFRLPSSARPGNYVVESIMGNIYGSTEVHIPPRIPRLHVRPLIPGLGAVAGQCLEGKIQVSLPDGSPFIPNPVMVELEADTWPGEQVKAKLVGPGVFAFSLPMPAAGENLDLPCRIKLKAKMPAPGSGDHIHVPFYSFLYADPLALQVEGPDRWVHGLSHRVRLQVLDMAGNPIASTVTVTAVGKDDVLAQGEYRGKDPLTLMITPPTGSEQLLFSARAKGTGEGSLVGKRLLGMNPPRDKRLDFNVNVEKTLVPHGSPLRVLVQSKRKQTRLWVNLVSRGMTTAIFPLPVVDHKGRLEIAADALPAGLFKVQAWRWEEGWAQLHEVSALALGVDTTPLKVTTGKGGEGLAVKVTGAQDSELLCTAYSGWPHHRLIPPGESLILGMLPGAGVRSDSYLRQLGRCYDCRTLFPEFQDELAPKLHDSWSGTGPQLLAKARLTRELGYLSIIVGGLLWLVGFVYTWRSLRRIKIAATSISMILAFVLMSAPVNGQAKRSAAASSEPLIIAPTKPQTVWWQVQSSTAGSVLELGPLFPAWGPGIVSIGGQARGGDNLLFGWTLFDFRPVGEVIAPLRGAIWPGDDLRVPLWVRLSQAQPQQLVGPGGVKVPFYRDVDWQRLDLVLRGGDLEPTGWQVPLKDQAGRLLFTGKLPLVQCKPDARHLVRGAGLGSEVVEFPVTRSLPGVEREVFLFANPAALAHFYLQMGEGEMAWRGSIDQVLGRGRIALALLKSPAADGAMQEIAQRVVSEAWVELTGFEKRRAGFGSYPAAEAGAFATVAALDFLLDAMPYLPDRGPGDVAKRAAQWLRFTIKRSGEVSPTPGLLADKRWDDVDNGRWYLTAKVARVLARFRSYEQRTRPKHRVVSAFLLNEMNTTLRREPDRELVLCESLARARVFLTPTSERHLGLRYLEPLVRRATGSGPLPEAGMALWNGATGRRADLECAGNLIITMLEFGMDQEKVKGMVPRLLAAMGPDYGWGDEWTTAACLEALLALTFKAPAGPCRVRVSAGGKALRRVDLAGMARVKVDQAKVTANTPLRVSTENASPGAMVLLRRSWWPKDPFQAFQEGPLAMQLHPVRTDSIRAGGEVTCILTIVNDFPEPIPRIAIRLPKTAGLVLVPGSLDRALARSEVSRVDWGVEANWLWFSHVGGKASRLLPLVFQVRVPGKVHIPPIRAWSSVNDSSRVWTAPVMLVCL